MSLTPAKPYQPTEREASAIEAQLARRKVKRPCPHLQVKNGQDGNITIEPDHVDLATASKLMLESIGTGSYDFYVGLLEQLSTLNRKGGKVSEAEINFMLAAINGIEPRDEAEAMLAAQMTAIHMATINAARYLGSADMLPQHDSATNALNKLTRTYAMQMETLKKYRRGNEQTVNVKHVHVNEGGQAIVGNVSTREGVQSKPEDQPHAKPLSHALQSEMQGAFETNRETLPQRRNG